MPLRDERDDDGDETDQAELDDRELPDPSDVDDDDDAGEETDTEPCPYCGKPVYDRADVCPHCLNFVSSADAPTARRPVWIMVGVALALIGALAWVLLG